MSDCVLEHNLLRTFSGITQICKQLFSGHFLSIMEAFPPNTFQIVQNDNNKIKDILVLVPCINIATAEFTSYYLFIVLALSLKLNQLVKAFRIKNLMNEKKNENKKATDYIGKKSTHGYILVYT